MTNFFDRFLQIADYKGYKNPSDFAKNGLGWTSSEKINRLKDNSKKPSVDILIEISNKFDDINPEWLLLGKGEMKKNTGNISIGGDNKGIANTGVIAGDSNVTINKGESSTENNTEDINNLLDSYNTNKGVEIDRLQALYTTMLESKDAIIEEKNLLIQELKEQIQELREDKKHLKSLLDKGNN